MNRMRATASRRSGGSSTTYSDVRPARSIDHGSRFEGEHGARIEEHYVGAVAVSTTDPGAARAEATARYVVAWPDATVSSEARLEVRSDHDAFEVTVELDVHDGDELFRSRRWYRHIPRRLQ